MSKCVTIVASVGLLLALAVVANKEFEVLNYPNIGCTGTPNVSKVPIDYCLPIPNNTNYTGVKYGFPRDVPILTIYPWANTNCTTYGEVAYVACGRCEPTTNPSFGPWHRLLCDVKTQKIRSQLQCSDNKCNSCAQTNDFAVGQCTSWMNGTAYIIATELKKSPALPEILFDVSNSTCDPGHAVRVFEAPCSKCLGNTIVNCTLTGTSVIPQPRQLRPLSKH